MYKNLEKTEKSKFGYIQMVFNCVMIAKIESNGEEKGIRYFEIFTAS